MTIHGDEPIRREADDLLGRAGLAKDIAEHIRRIDAGEGFVVGLLGPWGSGKTSLIHLIKEDLARDGAIPVLEFNPWMFSGTDQLMERFFAELASQLGHKPQAKFKRIAEGLARYGKVLSPLKILPILGPLAVAFEEVPKIAEAFKEFFEEGESGIAQQRTELAKSLAALDNPILVVIDDIDRLSPSEIRDIFRLVRLTASFPKIIYLVAFDRLRVEQALSEEGLSGRDYLEKIIQLPVDIPAVPSNLLTTQLGLAIDEALAGELETQLWTPERWIDVFWEIVRPLVRNMRDVRRYAAGLRGTVKNLDGKVSLVDVLGLEAVRVFLPDVFAAVIGSQDALTAPKPILPWEEAEDEARKKAIRKLVKAAGRHKAVALAMIDRLFPVAVRHSRDRALDGKGSGLWVRDGRVAHPSVLAFYLERVADSRLEGGWEAERAAPLLADGGRFEEYVRQKEPAQWVHILGSLWTFIDEIPAEAIESAIVAICNLIVEAPDRGLNPFAPDRRSSGRGLILRLLTRGQATEDTDTIVRGAFGQISSLSGKLELLHTVAHDEADDLERIVSELVWEELASDLRTQIREADSASLATERDFLWLLSWAKATRGEGEEPVSLPTSVAFGCSLLKAAVSQRRTQSLGTRAISVEPMLFWDDLVRVVGNEDEIRRIVERCREAGEDAELAAAVDLVQKYLGGYRPGGR